MKLSAHLFTIYRNPMGPWVSLFQSSVCYVYCRIDIKATLYPKKGKKVVFSPRLLCLDHIRPGPDPKPQYLSFSELDKIIQERLLSFHDTSKSFHNFNQFVKMKVRAMTLVFFLPFLTWARSRNPTAVPRLFSTGPCYSRTAADH